MERIAGREDISCGGAVECGRKRASGVERFGKALGAGFDVAGLGCGKRVRERGGENPQCLLRRLDERNALEAALDLSPVVPELLSETARVEVEALMQEHYDDQVGRTALEGAFRKLLE